MLSPFCAFAKELKELPPSCAPVSALALLSLPDQWLHEGLPKLNTLERRVRVFGYGGKRPIAVEGYAVLGAQTDGLPDPSLELSVWFGLRAKGDTALAKRFDAKVAEFNRAFAMSPELLSPGVAELRDDVIPPGKLPYLQQIALINHIGAEMEKLDVTLTALMRLGKYEYLLELDVRGLDSAGYGQLRRALGGAILEAASL